MAPFMVSSVEKILAEHSAPVLFGLKPAALFSLKKVELATLWLYAEQQLYQHGIAVKEMSHRGGNYQVMLYRPKLLKTTLANPQAISILCPLGYPIGTDLPVMLRYLKRRMLEDEYPHEIGLFLGYPPVDVLGFVLNKGRGYKLCGLWKVYGNEAEARRIFAQHDACRQRMVQHVEKGGSVCRLCAQAEAV